MAAVAVAVVVEIATAVEASEKKQWVSRRPWMPTGQKIGKETTWIKIDLWLSSSRLAICGERYFWYLIKVPVQYLYAGSVSARYVCLCLSCHVLSVECVENEKDPKIEIHSDPPHV